MLSVSKLFQREEKEEKLSEQDDQAEVADGNEVQAGDVDEVTREEGEEGRGRNTY